MQHSGTCLHHGSLQQSSPNFQDAVSHEKRELNLALSMDRGNSSGWLFPSSSWVDPLGPAQAALISPSQPGSQGLRARDREAMN